MTGEKRAVVSKGKKAVCLFSGGLDSTTVLYYALDRGYNVACLTIDYGQRHKREIAAARLIARRLHLKHKIITIDMSWGGSALTDRSIRVPQRNRVLKTGIIPPTYVPARNIIFLALAFSWAEVLGAEAVFIGVNQLDYSGYPDCRGEFLRAFEKAIRCGTKRGVEKGAIKIATPLLDLTKKEIALLARKLDVPVQLTWSCYAGGKVPCGRCDACLLREKGLREAEGMKT
jgi:7-cyano-7-deazaguanine synthase